MNLYCVVYRTGGTVNYQWHRSMAMTREQADTARQENERMGYRSMVVNYQQSVAAGLPETYE